MNPRFVNTFSIMNQTKKLIHAPVVVMAIGTTLLAMLSAVATWALFDTSAAHSPRVGEIEGNSLRALSLIGFAIYFGYLFTAIFRRHYFIFWLCSFLYNLPLVLLILYPIFLIRFESTHISFSDFPNVCYYILFLSWMSFMTAGSWYYAWRCLFPKKSELL